MKDAPCIRSPWNPSLLKKEASSGMGDSAKAPGEDGLPHLSTLPSSDKESSDSVVDCVIF